jgi:hypothetical protein
LATCESVNWKEPDGFSAIDPNAVQLLNGMDKFVAANTVKGLPGVLVKENLNAPAPPESVRSNYASE